MVTIATFIYRIVSFLVFISIYDIFDYEKLNMGIIFVKKICQPTMIGYADHLHANTTCTSICLVYGGPEFFSKVERIGFTSTSSLNNNINEI